MEVRSARNRLLAAFLVSMTKVLSSMMYPHLDLEYSPCAFEQAPSTKRFGSTGVCDGSEVGDGVGAGDVHVAVAL